MKKDETFFSQLPRGARLLLVRLRSLGDIVLLTPAIEALAAARPDLQLDLIVEKPFDEILLGNPHVRQVFAMLPHSTRDRFRLLPRIRRERYEGCWNLHGGTTGAALTALSGARARLGCETYQYAWLYNVRVPDSAQILGRKNHHTVERTLAWLRWLGLNVSLDWDAKIYLTDDERNRAREILKGAGIRDEPPYVVMQPGAVLKTKEWASDHFAAIADFLTEKRLQVVLTGVSAERSTLEAVRNFSRCRPAMLVGLSLRELAAVMERAHFFIGNDSGPTHLAAALKKPVVAIFGSSNSVAWAPWRTRAERVQNFFECNPCPGYRCLVYGQPECIRSVTVEQVQAAIERLLRSPELHVISPPSTLDSRKSVGSAAIR